MNGMTESGLPSWLAQTLGMQPQAADDQFESVLEAFARNHQRPKPPTPEQMARMKRLAKNKNPLHVKAVARRRKRKRGGPK